ncbi:MAG: hypothetical protein H7Y86_18215 [Rhizobacter sp.]|nr:hypothetical protein [Ferruginibacter sp.]
MAQEFNAAFGKDAYGYFGNDTTISQGDMDGVIMILLKELEASTHSQKTELAALKNSMNYRPIS